MMQSYADHRKRQLRSQVYLTSVKESLDLQFDVLRIDLLEAVKLPELLFEGSVDANASYNLIRKTDYEQARELVENVIYVCKSHFYESLLEDVATATASPHDAFKTDLINAVKEMVEKLRQQVTQILSASRGTDPAAGNTAGGAAPAGPAGGPTRPKPQQTAAAGGSEGDFEVADEDPGSFDTGYDSGRSAGSPKSGGSAGGGVYHGTKFRNPYDDKGYNKQDFKPADYGTLRPSDGWGAGFKRLLGGLVPQFIRRRWHNHPVRPMAKEHFAYVENLLVENTQQVLDVINSFEFELLRYIDDRVKAIAHAAATGTAPVPTAAPTVPGAPAAPAAAPGAPKKPGAGNALTGPGAKMPVGATAPEPEAAAAQGPVATDPNVALGTGGTSAERAAAAGDPQAAAAVENNLDNLKAGATMLGFQVDKMKSNWGTGANLKLPKDKILVDGQPISKLFSKPEIAKAIYERIYSNVMKKGAAPATAGLSKHVRVAVNDFLGLTNKIAMDNNLHLVSLRLLLQLGKMARANQITPEGALAFAHTDAAAAPAAAPQPPAGGAVKPAPSKVPAAGGAAAQKPVGSALTGPGAPMPVGASPTGSGAWPADQTAFTAKFKTEHPEGWQKFVAKHGDEAKAAKWLADGLQEIDAEFKPDDLADMIGGDIGYDMSPKAAAAPAPTTAPAAAERGVTPPAEPAAPAAAGSKASQFVAAAKEHAKTAAPAQAGLIDQLVTALSNDEMEAALANVADPVSDEAMAAIVQAATQKLKGAATDAGVADAGGTVPVEPEAPRPEPTAAAPAPAQDAVPPAAKVKGPKKVPAAKNPADVVSPTPVDPNNVAMPQDSGEFEFDDGAIEKALGHKPNPAGDKLLKGLLATLAKTPETDERFGPSRDDVLNALGIDPAKEPGAWRRFVARKGAQAAPAGDPAAAAAAPPAAAPAPAADPNTPAAGSVSGSSVEELAGKIGVDPRNLLSTLRLAHSKTPVERDSARGFLARKGIDADNPGFKVELLPNPRVAPTGAAPAPEAGPAAPAVAPEVAPAAPVAGPKAGKKGGKRGAAALAAAAAAAASPQGAPTAPAAPAPAAPAAAPAAAPTAAAPAGDPVEALHADDAYWDALEDMSRYIKGDLGMSLKAKNPPDQIQKHKQMMDAAQREFEDRVRKGVVDPKGAVAALKAMVAKLRGEDDDPTSPANQLAGSSEPAVGAGDVDAEGKRAGADLKGLTKRDAVADDQAKVAGSEAPEEADFGGKKKKKKGGPVAPDFDQDEEDMRAIRGGKGGDKRNKPQRGKKGRDFDEVFQSVLDDFLGQLVEGTNKAPKSNAKKMLMFS